MSARGRPFAPKSLGRAGGFLAAWRQQIRSSDNKPADFIGFGMVAKHDGLFSRAVPFGLKRPRRVDPFRG